MKYKYLISILASFIAFFVSAYLTILHFQNTVPPCTFSGCEVVLTSKYSEIMGIPVSLLGAIFYLMMIILSALLFSNFRTSIYKIYMLVITAGIGASFYFLFLQAAVIKEFCQYCLLTELSTLILFVVGITDIKKIKTKVEN